MNELQAENELIDLIGETGSLSWLKAFVEWLQSKHPNSGR